MSKTEDYIVLEDCHGRQVRQYSFQLNDSEYSENKIATQIRLNASTKISLWLGKSGNVIGLDFIQIKNTKENQK